MLGCTWNSCWRMPSNYLHGMSFVVVVSLEFLVIELILYVELLVVAEESLLGSSLDCM